MKHLAMPPPTYTVMGTTYDVKTGRPVKGG